jgi:hypothetical protein
MDTEQRNVKAQEFRNRNLAYLRTQDRHRLRSILDDYVRELLSRFPAVPGLQRTAEHLIRAAVTLLLLTLLAPGGVLETGIPAIAEQAGVSERTVIRGSKWLRNACRAVNRNYRGRKGLGVDQYAVPFPVVKHITERVRAAAKDRQRKGLERKRIMDDQRKQGQCATSADVASAPIPRRVQVGPGRTETTRERVLRLIGGDDDCEHGNPPHACAWCRRQKQQQQ